MRIEYSHRSLPKALLAALALYAVLALVGLFRDSPFRVAVERAAEVGGWTEEQVVFTGGSYGYRLLYSVAEADLRVATQAGFQRVHIEMRNTPGLGWHVSRFDRRQVL